MSKTKAVAVLGALALAVPGAAIADRGGNGHGHGQGKAKKAQYVFKGNYAGDGMVAVSHGNSRVRKGGFIGQTVSFDLTNTHVVVADTNGDGAADAGDVVVGDRVLVQAKLPKGDPGPAPFPARRMVDKTNPPEEDPYEEG